MIPFSHIYRVLRSQFMIMNTVVGYILLMTLVLSLSIGVFYGLRAIKLV